MKSIEKIKEEYALFESDAEKTSSNIEDVYVKAVLAGNNLIITSDYEASINAIKSAIENNVIEEEIIDNAVTRTLAWKYYKGLIE